MIAGRLWLLIRDLRPYPAEYGLPPGRAAALVALLDLSSHPRPLPKALRNDPQGSNIQSQQRSA